MKLPSAIPDWVRRWLTRPGGELTRWQRAVRYSIDLAWHCAKELRHDKASEMAAALTYRTIFSLIPILVISLVVFNAFEGFKELRDTAQEIALEWAGLDTLSYGDDPISAAPDEPPPGSPAEQATQRANPQTQGEKETADRATRGLVIETINELTEKIEQLPFASIGVIGFIILIWAALALVIALEYSFNQIYGAAEGRSLTQRVTLYWSTLTLGPVLLLASVYVANRAVGYVEEWEGGQTIVVPMLGFLSRFATVTASWLLLLFLYSKMPNTRVQLRAAAIGALVAAVLWELAKFGFGLYVRKALPYAPLYGSLGLFPLFLFWIYLTWLIVLFGLELTYTLQAMKGRRFKHAQHKLEDQLVDPAWMLPLAVRIAEAFRAGRAAQPEDLCREMNLPPRVLTRMAAALERAGLINKVLRGAESEGLTLAKPAERITVGEVMAAGQSLLPAPPAARDGAAWQFLEKVKSCAGELLEHTTLAELTREPEPSQSHSSASQPTPQAAPATGAAS